jgi:polyphosphate kinase 2 (PPK2 family)
MSTPRIGTAALPATPARSTPRRKSTEESCPLEQVDRLISDLESGQIRYNTDIQKGIRQQPLQLGNFPCKKYMLQASEMPYKSEEMPTEIVPKDAKSLYKKAVTVDSQLDLAQTEADLQARAESIREGLDNLFAQRSESLMVLLEGDNASGKDGMVKHVFHINPMTTRGQVAFKGATAEEKEHSPNWRIMKNLAGPGQIMFHNRSHYGDVVFAAKTPEARAQRLAEIKELEYGLTMGLPMTAEGRIALPDKLGNVEVGAVQRPPMRFIKVFVGVSQAEQAQRLADRLLDDSKIYKVTQADLEGRSQHHQIQTDFANAFAATSTPWAPSYYLPNDNKPMGWRKLAEITDEVLQDMDPHPPTQSKDNLSLAQRKQLAKELLEEAAQARRKG